MNVLKTKCTAHNIKVTVAKILFAGPYLLAGINVLVGVFDRIFCPASALKVERSPFFLFDLLYRLVMVNGVLAHTNAWKEVTVNTPSRPREALVDLETFINRLCKEMNLKIIESNLCVLPSWFISIYILSDRLRKNSKCANIGFKLLQCLI